MFGWMINSIIILARNILFISMLNKEKKQFPKKNGKLTKVKRKCKNPKFKMCLEKEKKKLFSKYRIVVHYRTLLLLIIIQSEENKEKKTLKL